MIPPNLTGGCFCGAVRYRLTGAPRRVNICYCLHCRRTSAALLVAWVEMNIGDLIIDSGALGSIESRPGVTRRFCPACGTPITYQNTATPESIDVSAGSLGDPEAVTPSDHLWCDRAPSWLKLDDGLPRYRLGRQEPRERSR